MTRSSSLPSASGRLLLAIALLASLVVLAGCSTTSDYTTSISEPTNGTVIDALSITDINEMDGVRYELQYSLPASANASYDIEAYERTDDASEFVSVSDLNRGETVHRNDVPPPWDAGAERQYELRVVHGSGENVIDTVTFTVEKERS